jgi:hypothetical protein
MAAEPAADASPADESAADEPWGAPATDADPWAEAPALEPEPWAEAADAEQADAGEDLPWLTQDAGGMDAQAEAPAPAEEPMPWETSFELSPEVPEDGPGERPAPRQEPTVGSAGGFSFEDFFSEPAAPAQPVSSPEPEPAPLPEPLPEPDLPPPAAARPSGLAASQPQGAEGGDEDEDLESFQAWLQSLKR